MKIIYQGKEVGLSKNIDRVYDIFGDNLRVSPKNIIACKCNNEVKSLDYKMQEGETVELIDLTDKDGMRVYIRGALYIMSMSINKLYPECKFIINYQLANSMFCEFKNISITDKMINNIKKEMNRIINADLKINKLIMSKKDAQDFFNSHNEYDIGGILQLENKHKEMVSLYTCDGYYNYFYGVMPISTGYINVFDLKKYKDGFILRYPNRFDPTKLGEFKPSKKYLTTLQEYEEINNIMGINNVKDLNEVIKNNKAEKIIQEAEELHENKIKKLAQKRLDKKDLKIILIAGPSSSSKTTFAKRLCDKLKEKGLNPVIIGTDNYFVERKDTPIDEDGEYDFETIDAIDIELFNNHLEKLINGEKIITPTFDFKHGTKRYSEKNTIQLSNNEIIIIEGIHSLNDKLTANISRNKKFKIYISDLTVLNIDDYNRISTTDTRLIRRIVRDHNYRSYHAIDTIKRWPSVNKGENKNIFPFQEEADEMFNSSLVYELSVLAKYAIPLLKEVKKTDKEYSESKRLVTFLEYFENIDEKAIPSNSLLREFIGGSSYEY